MTELMPYQPQRAELAVPAANDIDSWTQIVGQVVKLANEIYDTPFIPDGLRGSAAAVSACILAGREMGLGPMTSLANIDVIRGKPTQKPLLMRAMILSQGHKWEDVESTDFRAVVRGRRKDETVWTTVTFSADQAKKAGLNLGNWPADKLYARASSRLAKHKFADVIMGIPYTPEDVEDGLDVEVTVESDADAPAAIEAPKPRTAQRKQRTQSPPPAQAAPQSAASAPGAPPSPAGAGGALPPLPGEEDAPGPETGGLSANSTEAGPGADKHQKLVGTVQAHFKRLGYTDDDRDQRLLDAARIARVPFLSSLNDLGPAKLSTVADTLARCRDAERLNAVLQGLPDVADGDEVSE